MSSLVTRNILLSVLVVLLLIVILLFKERSPFGNRQASFASEPKNEITRVEFYNSEKRLVLTRKSDGWLVNGNKEARKSSIIFILRILTEMKIKSTVSPELFNKEIIEKGIVPVKVKVFEAHKLLKSFLVFKTESNKYGNFMKMREKAKPFIVYVPGSEEDIGSGFNLNELFWEPFILFNLVPSEISSITFENFYDPASSFEINCAGGNYSLSDTKTLLTGWDTTQVKRYISYFTHIPFENWAFDIAGNEKNRIETVEPVFSIKVRKTDDQVIKLSLWERRNEGSGLKDSDRLWGKTEGKDEYFIIRYFDVDPILKKRSYFFRE